MMSSAWLMLLNGRVDEQALRRMLAVNSSVEVVYNGIRTCLFRRVLTNRVDAVTLLLEANPVAAHSVKADGSTLALITCLGSDVMSGQECIDILKLLLSANKNAFKVADNAWTGMYPVHWLARLGPVEALEYLLDACPEVPATTLTVGSKQNLLHCVIDGKSADQVAKACLLCSRYPAMVMQRDRAGRTPLFGATAYYCRLLLRNAPRQNLAELRRLNWQERRTAMYVAYAARFPQGTKPALLARFRLENPDIVKLVVLFL